MSAEIRRPGPDRIPPARAPGGVVLHVYEIPSERLLLERNLVDADSAERTAEEDADWVATTAEGRDVCMVAYDGDSGERIPLRDVLGGARL